MKTYRRLETKLEYEFKNKELLVQALTHSSSNNDVCANYERLEFLGDRVLGVAMAHLLYQTFPNDPEGSLSRRHTKLVRKETVAKIAKSLLLDKNLIAENTSVCRSTNVLCDVAEAVIGAICIDGGVEEAIAFVGRQWQPLIIESSKADKDNKTMLQEVAHHLKFSNPEYILISKDGCEHQPQFSVKAIVEGLGEAYGRGSNKKNAEQEAAGKLLQMIGENNNEQ